MNINNKKTFNINETLYFKYDSKKDKEIEMQLFEQKDGIDLDYAFYTFSIDKFKT